jgi:carbonic anhydrase
MSTVLNDVITANSAYAETFGAKADLALPPARRFAILTCMDARLDPAKYAGLSEGDAHVIRNAGGVVTADELRSLAISQRLLSTREIVLIHHTDCGMLTFTDDGLKADIVKQTGIKPPWASEAFTDIDEDLRQSIGRIMADPFIPHKESVRGFVYDVRSGGLREVSAAA